MIGNQRKYGVKYGMQINHYLTCVLIESLDGVYSDKTPKFAFSQETHVCKQIDHIEVHIAHLAGARNEEKTLSSRRWMAMAGGQ